MGARRLMLATVLAFGWQAAASATPLPIVRQFPTPGVGANGLAFVGDDLWMWDVVLEDRVFVLDPADGEVRSVLSAPDTSGGVGLGYDGQYLWVCSGGGQPTFFGRFRPEPGALIETYPLPVDSPTGITFDGRYLWVSEIDGHTIAKVDPATGAVVSTITKEPLFSLDLAWDGEALWLSSLEPGDPVGLGDRSFINRIDPQTGATLAVYDGPAGGAVGMAIRDGLLYCTSWWENEVYVYQIPEPATAALLVLGLTCWPRLPCRRPSTRS